MTDQELKETLEKQLLLLSERSKVVTDESLAEITEAMISLYSALSASREISVW